HISARPSLPRPGARAGVSTIGRRRRTGGALSLRARGSRGRLGPLVDGTFRPLPPHGGGERGWRGPGGKPGGEGRARPDGRTNLVPPRSLPPPPPPGPRSPPPPPRGARGGAARRPGGRGGPSSATPNRRTTAPTAAFCGT